MNPLQNVSAPDSRGKVEASELGDETERMILEVSPEREAFDWICYRVRGGVDPATEQAVVKQASNDRMHRRPDREDIERALGRLVSLGLLTHAGGRWSMTSKGHAAP